MGRFRVIDGDLSDRILGCWRGCWSGCVKRSNAPYVGCFWGNTGGTFELMRRLWNSVCNAVNQPRIIFLDCLPVLSFRGLGSIVF